MPTKRNKRTRTAQKPTHSNQTGMSYDTKILIVVILLVFAYPLGVLLMWFWMRDWPLWLRIFITLPFVLGIVLFFAFFAFVGALIHSGAHWQNNYNMHYNITAPPTSSNSANTY